MRRIVFLLAFLTACFHPSYDHPTCGPGGECPDGLTCVAGVCQSAISGGDAGDRDALDGPPVDDRDSDTVPDTADNCPDIANPTQANEDGDAFGDACDPCPVDVLNIDSDSDGVGDQCDPNPGTDGDQIYLFEGFAGATAPSGLEVIGAWTYANGYAEATNAPATSARLLFTPGGRRETVSTQATITSFSSATNLVGVGDNLEDGTTEGSFCALDVTLQQSMLALYEVPEGTLSQSLATSIVAGTTYQLSLRRELALFRCTKDGNTISDTATRGQAAAPRSGLFVASSSARFDWLMVVTSP